MRRDRGKCNRETPGPCTRTNGGPHVCARPAGHRPTPAGHNCYCYCGAKLPEPAELEPGESVPDGTQLVLWPAAADSDTPQR